MSVQDPIGVTLDLLPPTEPAAPGLPEELALIRACARPLGLDAPLWKLAGVTGTAFRAHFFRPRDNPGMLDRPDPARPSEPWAPRYAWTSLRHNNYGHLEALSYFYGPQLRPVELPKVLELWRVLRFELEEGRPVIAWGLVEDGRPELVVGFRLEKSPLRQVLRVATREGLAEVDITGRKVLQGEGARYPNELLLVRPGTIPSYRGPDSARYADVLRWSWGHLRANKELVYESSRFYATGLAAWDAFAEFLLERVPEELADPVVCPQAPARDMGRFAQAVVAQWAWARAQGAIFARALAEELDARGGGGLDDLRGGAAELRALGEACEACAKVLGDVAALLEGDPALVLLQPALRSAAAQALCEGQAREVAVRDALGALAQR